MAACRVGDPRSIAALYLIVATLADIVARAWGKAGSCPWTVYELQEREALRKLYAV